MLSFPEDLTNYCVTHSITPSSICQRIESYTKANVPDPDMLSGPLVGSFLGFMIRMLGAKRALEIGTYTGYSALAMAESLPDEGELITLDNNENTSKLAQDFWDQSFHGYKIKPLLGNALDQMDKLEGNFDLVFIDADKTGYVDYFKKSLPLLSESGIIVADNCLWSGRVLEKNPEEEDAQAIQRFNEFVKSQKNLKYCLLPVRDGLFLIQK